MDPNQHPDVHRLRARGAQLRAAVREGLLELDAPAQGQLLRECAAGDLSVRAAVEATSLVLLCTCGRGQLAGLDETTQTIPR